MLPRYSVGIWQGLRHHIACTLGEQFLAGSHGLTTSGARAVCTAIHQRPRYALQPAGVWSQRHSFPLQASCLTPCASHKRFATSSSAPLLARRLAPSSQRYEQCLLPEASAALLKPHLSGLTTSAGPHSATAAAEAQTVQELGTEETEEDEAETSSSPASELVSSAAGSLPDEHWLSMFQQLKAYKEMYGDCLVPRRFWENPELGRWASQQRTDARGEMRGTLRRGPVTLHTEKRALLDSLDFPLKVEESVARWEANFHELRRYKEEHGNIDVPFKWRDPTYDFNNEFAKWFHAQPGLFTLRRLRLDQVRKLKMVGYNLLQVTGEDISAATYADERSKSEGKQTRAEFDVLFAELVAWKDKYHTTLVPKQVYDNPVLGMWVHRLRRDFKTNLLPQWQVDKLDSIQFPWKVDQISAKWHHNFHEARRYKELHGTGNVPAGYNNLDEPAFVEASRWLQRNAKLFNKDRLTVNRYWLLRNILGIKFVREYHPKGIREPGAKGKALARKKGPRPDVVARAIDLDRARGSFYNIQHLD